MNCKFYSSHKVTVVLILNLIFSAVSYSTGLHRHWISVGPDGGNISHIAISPSNPNIVYGLSGDYLVRSEDGGNLWQSRNIDPYDIYQFYSILISSLDSDLIMAKSICRVRRPLYFNEDFLPCLLRSQDGGVNWEFMEIDTNADLGFFDLINYSGTSPIRVVLNDNILNFNDSNLLRTQKIAVSYDFGSTWSIKPQTVQPVNHYGVIVVGIDAENVDILYGVGAFDSENDEYYFELHKSEDGGESWKSIQPEGTKQTMSFQAESFFYPNYELKNYFYQNPNDPQRLYSLFDIEEEGTSRWFTSDDGGLSWQNVDPRQTFGNQMQPLHFLPSPVDPETVYAAAFQDNDQGYYDLSDVEIAISTDAGNHWEINDSNLFWSKETRIDNRFLLSSSDSEQLFYANGINLFTSVNSGLDWTTSQSGIKLFGGDYMTSPLSSTEDVLLISDRSWIYLTADDRKQWQKVNGLLNNGQDICETFEINPIDYQDILCVSSLGGLFRSFDLGKSWHLVKDRTDEGFYNIKFSANGETFYYSSLNGQLYKYLKKEGGWHEQQLNWDNNLDEGEIIIHQILPSLMDPSIVQMIVSVNGESSIFLSTDAGQSWRKTVGAVNGFGKLIVHPNYPKLILFRDGGDVYLTQDSGLSWQPLLYWESSILELEDLQGDANNNLPVIFNPNNPSGLFHVDHSGSIYESKNLGKSWKKTDLQFPDEAYSLSEALFSTKRNVYAYGKYGVYQLSDVIFDTAKKDCLFDWAEKQYPEIFYPLDTQTQQVADYDYRYYPATQTYLGFYQNNKVHLLQSNLTTDIRDVGHLEYFMAQSGCDQ